MTDQRKILNGSFKGVDIAIVSGSIDGGRVKSIKGFAGRDTQSVEDIRLIPRKYSLEIIVSDKRNEDYFSYRNRLMAAIESKGSGVLIHPMYGRIDDVESTTFSLNENFSSFGNQSITVNFEINSNTGIPQSVGNSITEIASGNEAVQQAINADIAENFEVTPKFSGNFESAESKINSIISRVEESISFTGEVAEDINEFSAQIKDTSSEVVALVSQPIQLADAITDLMEGVNSLYASSESTFYAFAGFFGFGANDTEIKQETAGRIERKRNNDLLNSSVAASSLSYSYLALSGIDFETDVEIQDLRESLDDQYDIVQSGFSDQSVKDAVSDLRLKSFDLLASAELDASKIINVYTNPTSARLIAFNYYGNDDNGEKIVSINDIQDVSFIEGDIQVLTE